jgi:hypothetical protein
MVAHWLFTDPEQLKEVGPKRTGSVLAGGEQSEEEDEDS